MPIPSQQDAADRMSRLMPIVPGIAWPIASAFDCVPIAPASAKPVPEERGRA